MYFFANGIFVVVVHNLVYRRNTVMPTGVSLMRASTGLAPGPDDKLDLNSVFAGWYDNECAGFTCTFEDVRDKTSIFSIGNALNFQRRDYSNNPMIFPPPKRLSNDTLLIISSHGYHNII